MRFRIHVSSRGNIFMRELADYLLAVLRTGADDATVVSDEVPGGDPEAVSIVLAPHEYCLLEPAFQHCDQDGALRRSVLVNTEQPGTPWFEQAAVHCMRAGLIFDINMDGVSALRQRGIEAHHFPLCYHADLDRWGGDEGNIRDVDVVFMGDLTPRRSDLLAQYAHVLSHRRFEVLPTDSAAPIQSEGPYFLLGTAKGDLLRRTRILLDLHRGPATYFAWLRDLPAIANGAVVVTEPSTGVAPLRPFEHIVMAPYDVLPYYIEGLLVDDDRRQAMASAAYGFAKSTLAANEAWGRLAPIFTKFAWEATRRSSPRGRHVLAEYSLEEQLKRVPGDLPPRASPIVPPRATNEDRFVYPSDPLIKWLFVANRRLDQRLAELERLRMGVAAESVHTTPAWRNGSGDVSVVVPIHNHEEYVDDCLDSVLASTGVSPEVLVIDDASIDGSVARVRNYMERHPELPVAHIALSVNRGLPAVRNEGFRRARSEYVFLLDVDNLVYPRALARLLGALASTDAGFAYCLIEQFGAVRGLLSKHPWDVRRLLAGNYIDALSLVRRSTWRDVGGYVDSGPDADILYGWEDYDFWLSCAERSIHGVFVPEILARYRTRTRSMIAITNLETESAFAILRRRHPSLDWRPA